MHKILYHPRVEDDMKLFSRPLQKRIMHMITAKLGADPALYGKPLRHTLRNYYSLRAGDYRIIYFLEQNTVHVILVRHRKDVYTEALKRVFGE